MQKPRSRFRFKPLRQLAARSLPHRMTLAMLGFAIASLLHTTAPLLTPGMLLAVGLNPQQLLQDALMWIDSLGPGGAIAFVVLYMVATVAFLPGSILTLGGGAVFGLGAGFIYVFIGATLGAILAFLVGRYAARNWVAQKIAGNDRFQAIDSAVGREGFKIVLLTRLSPVFPFNLLNYAFGITGVSLRDYALGSIGMLPGTLLYVYLGSLAGSLATLGNSTPAANPTLQWTVRIVGLLATLAVTLYATRIARQALAETLPESPTPQEPGQPGG